MQAANYPLPLNTADGAEVEPVGFVASHQTDASNESRHHQRVVGVDCEMCYTHKALELARVTLVGEDEQVLLDELVLPDDPIVNYNTAYSGITPAMMQGITTTLAQIQQQVLQHVGPDTLLVGHALENDLRVLKLVHLRNLDTAILYPHARWPTKQHSLRSLASTYLDWTIQSGSHDSKQDAIAALRLVKLKLQHGAFFGTSTAAGTQHLMDVLHQHDRRCHMIDRSDVLSWLAIPSCKSQITSTDQDTVEAACQCLEQGIANLLWLQLWALSDLQEARGYSKLGKQKWLYPEVSEQVEAVSFSQCLQQLDAQVGQLWHALQPGALLLVVTGQGDTTVQRHREERAKEARYAQQLALATHGKRTGATVQHAGRDAQNAAANAMCFCVMK